MTIDTTEVRRVLEERLRGLESELRELNRGVGYLLGRPESPAERQRAVAERLGPPAGRHPEVAGEKADDRG